MRWRIALPAIGLILFTLISNESLRRHHPSNRYFYWSGIRLDSSPARATQSVCKETETNCWELDFLIVKSGLLTKLLFLLAMPAFILGAFVVALSGRVGVSQVWGFMLSMPLLITAWLYWVGRLIDGWKRPRLG